jgi:hypothetical protein
LKLLTLIRKIIRGKNFPWRSLEQQPPEGQTWDVEKDAPYCRYSVCSLIFASFSPPYLLAGMVYLILVVILMKQGGTDLSFSHFTLFLITGGCIISVLICGFFNYRKKSSERLYFDTRGLTLFKGEQCQWQCAYQEISCAKVVAAHSTGEENSRPEARIYLKSRKKLTIPWGMHRSTPPVSRASRSRLYLPFKLLKQRGIKVEFKKSMVRERLFNQSVLATAGLMIFVAGVVLFSFLYIKGKSSTLLVFDGRVVKSFTPWFRLYSVSFKSITAGSDNMIYVGTERSGVLRFDGKTFKSTGPGLPPKPVKYLFFDYTQDRPMAVIAEETWLHEGIAVYYLEQGKWFPLAPKILQGKKIYYLDFRSGEMLVSTDKGLYRFFNYRQSDSYEIFFKDRQVVRTFFLSGSLYVLTKRTTEKRFYYQTLYRRRGNDPDDWEEVFKDVSILHNIVACDKWGSIWCAKNAYSLANPQSGEVYVYDNPGISMMPVFRKALVKNGGIYLGVIFSTSFSLDNIEDNRKIENRGAVVMFDPGEKPSFVTIFDKIPLKTYYEINFTVDRQGNIWTISY